MNESIRTLKCSRRTMHSISSLSVYSSCCSSFSRCCIVSFLRCPTLLSRTLPSTRSVVTSACGGGSFLSPRRIHSVRMKQQNAERPQATSPLRRRRWVQIAEIATLSFFFVFLFVAFSRCVFTCSGSDRFRAALR